MPQYYKTGFESEAELVQEARPNVQRTLGNKHTQIIEEYGYGGGHTDLVVAGISPKYLQRRMIDLGLETPILTRDHLRAFVMLHRRKQITKGHFLNNLCKNRSQARKSLNWLMQRGFIEETEDGKIQTIPNIRRHTTSTYAVEFKLKDWKTGIKQAFRAKSYSKYQYVAMDVNHIDSAIHHIDEFDKYNIGLLSIDEKGDCSIEHKAKKNDPATPLSVWGLNEKSLKLTKSDPGQIL